MARVSMSWFRNKVLRESLGVVEDGRCQPCPFRQQNSSNWDFHLPKLENNQTQNPDSRTPPSQHSLGFADFGEAEKELNAASQHNACQAATDCRGQVSTSKEKRVGRTQHDRGAGRNRRLGGRKGGTLRLERDPTARYLLQKQPYEVLMRAAGLTTLPHVSRRHQPLARREALAVHFGGGDRSKRTLDTPCTHY